jgi:lactose/L-arabinose transport system substrate-binding protein
MLIVALVTRTSLFYDKTDKGMEEMKKTFIKSMLAGAVTFACLANVAQAETVTVWAWDPNFNVAIMEEAGKQYSAIHPDITIKVVDFSKASIEQKLHTMLASGVTSALPDVVLIEDYNAQKYLQSYPGSFAPLTSAINYENFAPYKVNIMTIGKEVYGVPFDSGVSGLYYRTDILAKAGFTAKDLENITWQRFIEIGKQVKAKTGIAMLGNDPSDMGLLRIMMQSAGAWYFNKDGSLNIKNNEGLTKAIERFRDLHVTEIARPTVGWSSWVGAVNKGTVATMTSGVWITASIKSAADQAGKWAIAPTPRIDVAGSVNSSNLGGSSWYVMTASDEKQQAIDFLNTTFASGTDFYETILKDKGAVGSYIPVAKTAAYQFKDAYFGGQEIYADFTKWLVKVPEVNYGMYTYEVDAAIAAQMPAIIRGAPVNKVLERVEEQLAYQIR